MTTIACLGLLDLLQLPVGLDDDLADRLDRDLGRFRGRETFGQTLKDDPKKAVEIECRGGAADIILSVRTRRKSFYGRGEIVKYHPSEHLLNPFQPHPSSPHIAFYTVLNLV